MSVYFTSDLHLGHLKVVETRGHATSEQHTDAILDQLLPLPPGSQLWILGDLSVGGRAAEYYALEILRMVAEQGIELHLIAGNHDSVHPMHRDAHRHQRRFLDVFTSVQAFARRRIAGQQVLLSHFPYNGDHTETERHGQYRLRNEKGWLLHGHTHSQDRGPEWCRIVRFGGGTKAAFPAHRQIHVGWDAWSRPVHIEEIAHIIRGDEA